MNLAPLAPQSSVLLDQACFKNGVAKGVRMLTIFFSAKVCFDSSFNHKLLLFLLTKKQLQLSYFCLLRSSDVICYSLAFTYLLLVVIYFRVIDPASSSNWLLSDLVSV